MAQPADPRDKRVAELERELKAMKWRAERAEALVELQKKVSELLGIAAPRPTTEDVMAVVVEHAPRWGIDATCKALGIGHAVFPQAFVGPRDHAAGTAGASSEAVRG